jgi:hypothetical protein
MGLQDELNAMLEKSMAMIPEKTAAIMAGAMKELENANITDQSLRKGDKAPEFELPDAEGKMISCSRLLKKGPLVISFYRGSW